MISKATRRDLANRRRESAAQQIEAAKQEGLAAAGKEHAFFRALNIGESRRTSYAVGNIVGGKVGAVREQWWVPSHLVQFNAVLRREGFSSKLRAKAIRALADGQELPERFHGAVARYTEELLLRQG